MWNIPFVYHSHFDALMFRGMWSEFSEQAYIPMKRNKRRARGDNYKLNC